MTIPVLQWTPPARAGLERYFEVRLAPDQLDGSDPEELRHDLRTHLEEELTRHGVTIVTLEDLRQALAKMGEVLPPPASPLPPAIQAPAPAQAGQIFAKPKPYRWIRFAGLVFPLFVFLFEIVTRGSAGMLFDPMPDLVHHLMVLLVPLAAWTYLRSRSVDASPRLRRVVPWLTGAALAVAVFYTICYLPSLPMVPFGIFLFGAGLLPLAPILSLTALRSVWNRLKKTEGDGGKTVRRLRLGFVLMTGLIALIEGPMLITRYGIHLANQAGRDPEQWASAVRLVRGFGSDHALLRACYDARTNLGEGNGGPKDPASMLFSVLRVAGGTEDSPMNAGLSVGRDLYYRVTGQPFNEAARPRQFRPLVSTQFNFSRRFGQDEDRGGTGVAGRIDGLSLGEGRMDWHCEAASGLTWGEWTLTFENKTGTAEEARCRISLPPGGFVSRVTLWVDGKPEEAAYSTVSKVRAAYQSVAVVQRRDPVLVTQPDAGSILVQAFPVPARGQLKTRLTFTVPAGADQKVWLPSIVERNFELPAGARHPLWVQADHGTLALPAELQPHAAQEAGAPTVTGSLANPFFTGAGTSFTWSHQPAETVFSSDPFAKPEARIVVRNNTPSTSFQPDAIAWVIDASAPLEPHRDAIAGAVRDLSVPGQTGVFIPGDAASELQTLTDPSGYKPSFAGGRDNTPALTAAVEWLRGKPGACLIWVHGPQPAAAASRSALEQILERSTAPFTLVDVPLVPGENTLSPSFSALPRLTTLPVRHAGPDLTASLRAAFQQRGGSFTTLAEGTLPPDGAVKTSDTLVRWFARTEAARLGFTDPAAASAMAASHQIVSPWSGAVVLERASDYAQHGLEQSNAAVSQQIPVIPEPSGVMLLLFSASHFLLRRRRGAP